MGKAGAITALAATASGLLYLSLIFGTTAAPLVAYFIQLPLLFCGLAFGFGSAALASAGGTAVALATGGIIAAAIYLVVEVAPALFFIGRVRAARPDTAQPAGRYSLGRVATELALLASLLALAALLWTGLGRAEFASFLERLWSSLAADVGNDPTVARARAFVLGWADWLPGVIVASWIMMTLVNGVLAQLLVRRAGLAWATSGPFAELEVPGWGAIVLAVALAMCVIGGNWFGLIGRTWVLAAAVPFLILGLAVIHAFVRQRRLGKLPLVAFYLVLLVFSWPLAILVVLLGIIEDVVGVRRRFAS